MSAAIVPPPDPLVCPAEDGPDRCTWGTGSGYMHACNYDDGHDGSHECGCGHRWSEED